MRNTLTSILGILGFLGFFYLIIVHRSYVSEGIYSGIAYSLTILIPSIMPFMFISGLFTLTKPSVILCKLFSPIARYIFRISPVASPCIIFGLTCGYPVGAKLTSDFLEKNKITREESGRLLAFTLNPGIPFCVLFLGDVILNDIFLGWRIYFSILLGNIILGFFLSFFGKIPPKFISSFPQENFMLCVKKSADSTIRACLNMSFYIVIFWGIIGMLKSSGIFDYMANFFSFSDGITRITLLSFFMEVTSGIDTAATLQSSLYLFVIGLSFGGICIHFQVFSFFKKAPVKYIYFLATRILHSYIALGLFKIFDLISPRAVETFSTHTAITFSGIKGNFVVTFCIVLLFITYIFMCDKRNYGNDQ